MIAIETNIVPFPSDNSPAVLLQLPEGYVVMRPADADRVGRELIERAREANARQN